MNGKFKESSSLEGQLAAIAVDVIREVENRINTAHQSEKPSASDFEQAFRIHVEIKELTIRLDEQDRLETGRAELRSDLLEKIYRLMGPSPARFNQVTASSP